ncbi:hypothetical protein [Desulforhopalus sp. IMCC35007]|uniref:hypothetical protein n=1 Tax=Desulforhopalus sp. IMCC35007 TaxID=2569543 RepID=UPI0010ADB5D8|nr:hypothetical protein [Desulforhopalus sp. IMCC35007]TKB11336.1 hypothetical protein FCL48_04830 [Desulforhopalus sp. IMCC35007]
MIIGCRTHHPMVNRPGEYEKLKVAASASPAFECSPIYVHLEVTGSEKSFNAIQQANQPSFTRFSVLLLLHGY